VLLLSILSHIWEALRCPIPTPSQLSSLRIHVGSPLSPCTPKSHQAPYRERKPLFCPCRPTRDRIYGLGAKRTYVLQLAALFAGSLNIVTTQSVAMTGTPRCGDSCFGTQPKSSLSLCGCIYSVRSIVYCTTGL
jgi:hypothetical protein